ncbi:MULTISPECIES: hypothetical protein [unclassified Streptomyces]|uniref:hypothetical protein n=1 Tax=unclassified Streptomyces TaxID=2593676 RepID=UPI000B5094BD|nr:MULTISPECIES: hypothetical protein [unclassified Streptomyces]MYX00230.1 hypothetical protein [Streptomyces sp. SID8378]SNB87229.1 hypothetical protein SAMN02745831_03489 [Streptomyces sp. PgraA7]
MSVRTLRKAAATLTASLTLAGGAVVAGGGTANAATCYGGATYFSGETNYYPSSGTYVTTSRCNDINIKVANLIVTPSRKVKVCFYKSNGALNYCQSNYTTTYGSWTVVATDVKDGTRFRFAFESKAWVQAYRAA